jgi:hypothetical protein
MRRKKTQQKKNFVQNNFSFNFSVSHIEILYLQLRIKK